jgi:hypothetical protein
MRLFGRTSWKPKPVPASPSPAASLRARIEFFRALFRAEQQRMPSVDAVQAQDAQEQQRRADAGTDTIARALGRVGVWFPGD